MNHFTKLLLLSFLFCYQLFAFEKHGNYLDIRIGTPADTASRGLLYYPDREIMFDFDVTNPFEGVNSIHGNIQADSKYYMTARKRFVGKAKSVQLYSLKHP